MSFKNILFIIVCVLSSGIVSANCGITSGRVNIIGNEFPAIQIVGANARECESDGVKIRTNLTSAHKEIQVAGLSSNPSEYTSAIVANSTIVTLLVEDLIRPLDDLVEKYGQDLQKHQLITVNGKIMAIAFMANAQHLVYREDILKKAGVSVPKTYEELLENAKIIREKGLLQNPVGGAYKAGWNLAQEFTNMYIGFGGEFFKPGTAEAALNNDKGIKTLEMLKKLTAYMNPDYLTHDSNVTSSEWKAGNVAMMSMWGSRVRRLIETEGATPDVIDYTSIDGPMTVGGGTIPATTLWWDGWTIAKNISDEDAEASFKALLHGIRPEILNELTMPMAAWLIEGYQPKDALLGVFASVKMKAKPYPMLPYQGLLHRAIGAELVDFLLGKEDAVTALSDIEAAYNAAAKEKGFL